MVSPQVEKIDEKRRELRRGFLKKRDNLSRIEIESGSKKIEQRLFTLPEFQKARTIMFYVSFRSEVETDNMIRNALDLKKKVVVPVVEGEKIEAREIENPEKELAKGTFGIREPREGFSKKVDPKEIDLVVVPGVVFDKRGGRLGYGRGYYDRFLRSKSIRPMMHGPSKRVLVGLAFHSQITGKIPLLEKDVRVDKIVTESRVIDCKEKRAP